MLILNNVKIYAQNLGTILAVFLQSDKESDIQQRFNSFWNHEATGGELTWWNSTCGMFWIWTGKGGTANHKLRKAMIEAAFAEILNAEPIQEKVSPINPDETDEEMDARLEREQAELEASAEYQEKLARAIKIADERIESIEWVTWFHTDTVLDVERHTLGNVGSKEGIDGEEETSFSRTAAKEMGLEAIKYAKEAPKEDEPVITQ